MDVQVQTAHNDPALISQALSHFFGREFDILNCWSRARTHQDSFVAFLMEELKALPVKKLPSDFPLLHSRKNYHNQEAKADRKDFVEYFKNRDLILKHAAHLGHIPAIPDEILPQDAHLPALPEQSLAPSVFENRASPTLETIPEIVEHPAPSSISPMPSQNRLAIINPNAVGGPVHDLLTAEHSLKDTNPSEH